jgi:probable rRNA maturation factor
MKLEILNDTRNRLPGEMIRELFKIVVEGEADADWKATVNVVFVGDRRMQSLNHKHRRLNRPTDVLSFNLDRPETSDGVFGELYISCDAAKRQARAYGVSIIDEYVRLTCHGLLHLFGYDHKKTEDAAVMRNKEIQCLDLMKRT